jgi:hypothetical protein
LVRTLVFSVLMTGLGEVRAQIQVEYLYRLSNFSGVIPYSDVQLHADRYHDEVYIGEGDTLRVFNAAGMEIYEFTHDAMALGTIADLIALENGDILVLSYRLGSAARPAGAQITRYNYRGDEQGELKLSGLPPEFQDFVPNRMISRGGKLYLASTSRCLVVVAGPDGAFERAVDLLDAVPKDDKAREGAELGGFDVDAAGTIYFTIPTAFRAFRRFAEGSIESCGKPGSAPGSFGVTGSIVVDEHGDLLVADRARNAVLVFGPNLRFLREFGATGKKQELLTRPGAMTLGKGGKLYVSQLGSRGVSVFTIRMP